MDLLRKGFKSWGITLLAIWLILAGVVPLLRITFIPGIIGQLLAIAAGVLLLLNK